MSAHLPQWSIRSRLIAMAVIIVGAIAFIFVPINTWLGVKVKATGDQHGNEIWDKRGNDMIWNIWWRAHEEMLDLNQTLVTIGLFILLAAFIACTLAALWYALSIPAIDETATEE
jgi:hypothetical protein